MGPTLLRSFRRRALPAAPGRRSGPAWGLPGGARPACLVAKISSGIGSIWVWGTSMWLLTAAAARVASHARSAPAR